MKRAIAVLLLGLASVCPKAGAQCSGYSANAPQYTALLPSQEAAQGGVTATFTQTISGGLASHSVTAGSGSGVTYTWSSSNGVSATSYFTTNGGNTHYPWIINSLNGSATYPTGFGNGAGQFDDVYFVVTDQHGNITVDRIHQVATGDRAGTIVSQDGIYTNMYYRITTPFNGPPMAQACQQCIDYPSSCQGIQHTPYISMSFTNSTSGETHSMPRQVAGNDASENEYIYGTGSMDISALSGDQLDGESSPEIDCPVVGALLGPLQIHMKVIGYETFDKVDSWDGNLKFTVEPWCYNPPPLVTVGTVYKSGNNPQNPYTFFYSLGLDISSNFLPPGWHASPGIDIPFKGTVWIKSYCTPYQPAPY